MQTVMIFLWIVLTVTALAAVLMLLVFPVVALFRRTPRRTLLRRVKKTALLLAVALALNAGLVLLSQVAASTPPIRDETGNTPDHSIAELTMVVLNGREQWISLRGQDADNPVLLFLAGGPGGTQMAAVRHELSALEEHFVVVNWDQPGSGKSYHAEPIGELTVDTYLRDGTALTAYLKERFGEEKIYLVGESWGSALGIFMVAGDPSSYHAFIGTGQMVDFIETEQTDYALALSLAEERGDTDVVGKLERNGPPPYYGKDVTWNSAVYLNYLSAHMARNPDIRNAGYNTFRDLGSPEYGLWDKINYLRGIVNTFNHVYPQLYDIDLRETYAELEVPVYFFLGRHDVNAPTALVEEYLEVLVAPDKEIVWFEHSGHSPWINERDRFAEELLARFRPDAEQQ